MKVAIIGLGIMGSAYAGNLIAGGAEVEGTDPLDAARQGLAEMGGTPHEGIGPWVRDADLIILSLASPKVLHAVAAELAGVIAPGQIVAETGTFALADKHAAREVIDGAGGVTLDCTVSGTGAQARVKDLLMMTSGPEEAVKKIEPILEKFTKGTIYGGEFGNGARLKYVANHAVALHNCAAAETLHYARSHGLPDDLVYKMLSTGAGHSRMLELRMPMMISGEYRPATANMSMFEKDFSVIGGDIETQGVATPMFDAVREVYDIAYAELPMDLDTASVYEVYREGRLEKDGS
jgi:3-hydroxyisobutyrate dehydrogenase-like beta-hydroxyacid dehydrogenase